MHLHEIKDKPVGPAVTIGVAQAHDSAQDLYFDYVLVSFSGARPPGGDFPRGLIREYLAVDPTEMLLDGRKLNHQNSLLALYILLAFCLFY